jgi:hypothetical protein
MISEERVEKAVEFIRDHADQLGNLVGVCKGLEQRRKVVHGQNFLEASGTVAEREAKAYSSDGFMEITEEIENAWAEKTTVETKIRAAELTIDVWRSQYSKLGKGHL